MTFPTRLSPQQVQVHGIMPASELLAIARRGLMSAMRSIAKQMQSPRGLMSWGAGLL